MEKRHFFLAGVLAFLIALAGVAAANAEDNGNSNNSNPNKTGQGISDVRLGF